MTPHYLANLLRSRYANLRALAGWPPIDLTEFPDEDIIFQEELDPRQLAIAIARSETLSDFQRFCRYPALVDGSYLLFRPGRSAILRTLRDKRYFKPPRFIDEVTEMAMGDNEMHFVWRRYIQRECQEFFRQYQVADFDILGP